MHATLTYPTLPGARFFTRSNVRGYCFGFNGKEKVDEVYGDANAYDFGARIYDPRLGRWLAVDPLQFYYSDLTPFNFSGNNPVLYVDYDGKFFGKLRAKAAAAWLKITGKEEVDVYQNLQKEWCVSYRDETIIQGKSLFVKNYGVGGIKARGRVYNLGIKGSLKGSLSAGVENVLDAGGVGLTAKLFSVDLLEAEVGGNASTSDVNGFFLNNKNIVKDVQNGYVTIKTSIQYEGPLGEVGPIIDLKGETKTRLYGKDGFVSPVTESISGGFGAPGIEFKTSSDLTTNKDETFIGFQEDAGASFPLPIPGLSGSGKAEYRFGITIESEPAP